MAKLGAHYGIDIIWWLWPPTTSMVVA